MAGRRHPAVVDRLLSRDDVADDDRITVEKALADELMNEIHGPDWEPTDYGRRIENAIDGFLGHYPIEHTDE